MEKEVKNRPLRFRAWDKINMHDISFINFLDGGVCLLRNKGKIEKWSTLSLVKLMQYTGLKDKNGKEIYEGDILSLDGGGKPCIGSVGFERGCFTFNASWLDEEKQYMPELYRYTFFAELEKGKLFKDCVVVEIIGNIYENPELIGEVRNES